MAYALPGGLSFCVAGDRLVFLDLPSDRYFCLSPHIEAGFRDLIEGRTPGVSTSNGPQSGNLLIGNARANDVTQCIVPPVTGEICGEPENMAALDGLTAIGWILRSRTELRLRGLATAIQHLVDRKASVRKAHAMPAAGTAQERKLIRVAESFAVASGIIDTHGRCLPWSLAIAHRLLSVGITPLLILGVRLTPFAAHAWVQVGGTLINEHRERTDVFTPILVV